MLHVDLNHDSDMGNMLVSVSILTKKIVNCCMLVLILTPDMCGMLELVWVLTQRLIIFYMLVSILTQTLLKSGDNKRNPFLQFDWLREF